MNIHTSEVIYKHGEAMLFHGFCAYDETITHKRPAVIVVHDWSGQNDFARNKAKQLAEMGYVGFAVDMYGNKQEGQTKEEKMVLMSPLMENRVLLIERMMAAVKAVKSVSVVDAEKIAAIGYCFGGLCVLDLARSGENLSGVVSFHGLLEASPLYLPKKITAKVLALHGYDDPMVPLKQVQHFAQEMTTAQADWQMHMYGNTMHAFTNPLAHDPDFGTVYSSVADNRSWQAASNFLASIFK